MGNLRGDESFPAAARRALPDVQLRRNLGHATRTIRAKRAAVVGEVADWEELREAGRQLKTHTMANLDRYLIQLEEQVTAHGGTVHWARDATEANQIAIDLVRAKGVDEVVKVKSMATQEIGLNEAFEAAGIAALETDLAELIVQLGGDKPSHILVPAIHRNRAEIRDIFLREMADVDPDLTDQPAALAGAARRHLRRKFLQAKVAISGANFAVAETGTLSVVESEGNGRMCLTLPETLITIMGIEKIVPRWRDLEVFLQLLPRSSTGERMNPYTSMWTGVTPGDGPQEFHLILLDNGRTAVLSDAGGRDALNCIRCSACLNVCPVYERAGGHAYGSVYPGPIGAILSPQLTGIEDNASLPYASSLCGACYDVCPVKINIPEILVHLRARHTETYAAEHRAPSPEAAAMAAVGWVMSDPKRWSAALRGGRLGRLLGRQRGVIGEIPLPVVRSSGPKPVTCPGRRSRRSATGGSRSGSVSDEPPVTRCWPGFAPRTPRPRPRPRRTRRCSGTTAPPPTMITKSGSRSWSTGWWTIALWSGVRRLKDLAATIAAALAERGARSVVVPAGLDRAWLEGVEVEVRDDGPDGLERRGPGRDRRGPDRVRRRGRRDRHARARRVAGPGPPGDHPGARLPPLRRGGRPDRRRRARGAPPAGPDSAADLDQRAERDQRHRAEPRRGGPRPPHSRSDHRRLSDPSAHRGSRLVDRTRVSGAVSRQASYVSSASSVRSTRSR